MKKVLIVILLLFGAIVFFYFLNPKTSQAPSTPEETKGATKAVKEKKERPAPKLSIESIFDDKVDTEGLDETKIIRLIATGDVIPARGANWPAVTSKDFTYNWKKTSSLLKSGDLTLINLEAPLIKGCPLMTEGFTFCGDARHIEGIAFAGVDSVSLANNHIGNYGQEGIDETISLLESKKIGWNGFNHLDIHKVKGVKFGFLAYNGISRKLDVEAIKSEIKRNKPKVDVLVVAAHWGDEYVLLPQSYGNIAPDDPKEVGPQLIDAGADLIIGNHPHTVQGVQIYNGKLITYAHGNFIFDQTWSPETQEGVVGEYIFYDSKLTDVKYHPTLVDVSYQPKLLSKKAGQHILDRMLKSSKQITDTN
jgi:poly-gamma-glutamate synthesis protein (capsule biosynthesis protein)